MADVKGEGVAKAVFPGELFQHLHGGGKQGSYKKMGSMDMEVILIDQELGY